VPTYIHQVLPLACLHIWEQYCSKCATQIFLHGLCRTLWRSRCEESTACGCIRRDGTCVDVTICNSSDTKEHASCSGGGIECTVLEIIEAVVAESALHDNGSRTVAVNTSVSLKSDAEDSHLSKSGIAGNAHHVLLRSSDINAPHARWVDSGRDIHSESSVEHNREQTTHISLGVRSSAGISYSL
jgi:hypothetical protein